MQELIKSHGRKAFDAVKGELVGVGAFIGVVWAVFLLDSFLPLTEWCALAPRSLQGLTGVVAMPFLHGDLSHILANTFPLFVLLGLLAGSRANSWRIVTSLVVVSGLLIWVGAGSGTYVGASALVFGLIGFLIASGFLEQRPIPLLISIVVGVMYGWTVIMGILPLSAEVSELSHFYGLVAGVGLAYFMSFDKKGRMTTDADAKLPPA